MYSGKADWDVIARVKQALSIPVIGNGDVFSGADALAMRAYTHCDGIMVARGAQGNPFIFQEIQAALAGRPYTPPTPAQRLDMALEHLRRAVEYKGERAYVEMRKHMAWYIRGIRGGAQLRARVNLAPSADAMARLLREFRDALAADPGEG